MGTVPGEWTAFPNGGTAAASAGRPLGLSDYCLPARAPCRRCQIHNLAPWRETGRSPGAPQEPNSVVKYRICAERWELWEGSKGRRRDAGLWVAWEVDGSGGGGRLWTTSGEAAPAARV